MSRIRKIVRCPPPQHHHHLLPFLQGVQNKVLRDGRKPSTWWPIGLVRRRKRGRGCLRAVGDGTNGKKCVSDCGQWPMTPPPKIWVVVFTGVVHTTRWLPNALINTCDVLLQPGYLKRALHTFTMREMDQPYSETNLIAATPINRFYSRAWLIEFYSGGEAQQFFKGFMRMQMVVARYCRTRRAIFSRLPVP